MQTLIPIFHGNHEAQGDQLSYSRELVAKPDLETKAPFILL